MKADATFSPFYKTRVEIYRIKRASSYSEEVETELAGSVMADVQPCGGSVDERERGLAAGKSFKLYCGSCDAIREGGYAALDGSMYRIASVKRWEIGIEALLTADDTL